MNWENNRTMEAGRMPRPGRKGDNLLEELSAKGMLLFVGSVNCLRHKPYRGIGSLMREGRAALLCPSMSDFSSGRYLNQIVDALAELSREYGTKQFVIACGCQWVILSTDGELLKARVKQEYDIDLSIFEDAHLEFGDHE
ncbi:MAG: hypothetical protein LUG93_08245 [Lachnospiraceae bacterium]|nr:hypothetical protein [Lachnospiraceae bacterium]